MKRYLLTIFSIFSLLSTGIQAQVGVKVTPTGRHAEMIKKVKDRTVEWDKEKWQAYKDSLKQVQKIDKQAKKELDSLFKASKEQKKLDELFNKHAGDTTKIRKLKERALKKGIDPTSLPSVRNDSSLLADVKQIGDQNLGQYKEYRQAQEYIGQIPKDSATLAKTGDQQLSQFGEYNQAKDHGKRLNRYRNKSDTTSYGELLKEDSAFIATTAQEHLGDFTDNKEFQELSGFQEGETGVLNAPGEYEAYGEDFNKRLQNLQEMDQPTVQDLEGIEDQFNSEKAEQLLADNSDKLTEAKEVMQKLKKKYTSVPNSNDLKDAVKRNSLEEKKFIERLSFGGNFQITSTDPVIIDASPTVAYGVSKVFQVGLGITYRQTFGNDTINRLSDQLWGYRTFGDYNFWKGFFSRVEYEQLFQKIDGLETEAFNDRWDSTIGFSLGLGKRFKIKKKISAFAIIQYNFLHSEEDGITPNAWSPRFGVDFTPW